MFHQQAPAINNSGHNFALHTSRPQIFYLTSNQGPILNDIAKDTEEYLSTYITQVNQKHTAECNKGNKTKG
jgi:hypothetical protein